MILTQFPALSETFILDQITGLQGSGCEVDIYSIWPGGAGLLQPEVTSHDLLARTIYLGMPIEERPRLLVMGQKVFQKPGRMKFLASLPQHGIWAASARLFADSAFSKPVKEYDVIHCQFGPNGVVGALLKQDGWLRGEVVTSFLGYDLSRYLRRRFTGYSFLFDRGALFLPVSEKQERQLIQLGCPRDRIKLHRLGIDTVRFRPIAKKNELLEILSIGRLVDKKGITDAVKAVASLQDLGIKFHYNIIGDGPQRTNVAQIAAEQGMTDNITFTGWQTRKDIQDALQKADIFLAPSRTAADGDEEGTPVVLLEAMASGLPVISTLHGGIPEIVKQGEYGFLVPERDVAKMKQALIRLGQSVELRSKMGAAGRRYVMQHHDIKKLNQRLLELYQAAVSTRVTGA